MKYFIIVLLVLVSFTSAITVNARLESQFTGVGFIVFFLDGGREFFSVQKSGIKTTDFHLFQFEQDSQQSELLMPNPSIDSFQDESMAIALSFCDAKQRLCVNDRHY